MSWPSSTRELPSSGRQVPLTPLQQALLVKGHLKITVAVPLVLPKWHLRSLRKVFFTIKKEDKQDFQSQTSLDCFEQEDLHVKVANQLTDHEIGSTNNYNFSKPTHSMLRMNTFVSHGSSIGFF